MEEEEEEEESGGEEIGEVGEREQEEDGGRVRTSRAPKTRRSTLTL